MTVILAGTLGAMFSMLTRLYAYTDLPHILSDPNIPEPSRLHKLIYGAIPPVTGAIAATVLYLCFAGNILGGGIFPEIACRGEGASCESFQGLIDNYGPKKGVDYAKALVWGFIAGFAERLVPNVLGSLAQQAEQQANK